MCVKFMRQKRLPANGHPRIVALTLELGYLTIHRFYKTEMLMFCSIDHVNRFGQISP